MFFFDSALHRLFHGLADLAYQASSSSPDEDEKNVTGDGSGLDGEPKH